MNQIFDYEYYKNKLQEDKRTYTNAEVFPHIVLDNFINPEVLTKALADFPPISDNGWIHYVHFNENKGGLNKMDLIPASLRQIIDEFNSPAFVKYLRDVTGIPNLIADTSMEGGGLHQIPSGGFLNIHADFSAHPHHRLWRRRVNLLLYLNKDWKDEYGGHLELWTKDMKQAFTKISPIFDRCVIFNTDLDSYHGHPEPLACPQNMTRKSIALYYYTEEKEPPVKVATVYHGRPNDGAKKILIWLDNKVLSIYNRLKGVLGINDQFVSKLLNIFSRKK